MLGALCVPMAAVAGCLEGRLGTPDDDRDGGSESGSGPDETQLAGSSPESVAAHFDDPVRPACERHSKTIEIERGGEVRTFETAETRPYPDPPETFTRDDVLDYLDEFDRAYVTHDVLCGRLDHILNVGYSVRARETIDWYDEIPIVFLLRAAGAAAGVDDDGNAWEAELGIDGVVYAVDESGVARAESDAVHSPELDELESRAPDPLERGRLVARFE